MNSRKVLLPISIVASICMILAILNGIHLGMSGLSSQRWYMVSSHDPAQTNLIQDILQNNGIRDVIFPAHQDVYIDDFGWPERINLLAIQNRLDPWDTRITPYIDNLKRFFVSDTGIRFFFKVPVYNAFFSSARLENDMRTILGSDMRIHSISQSSLGSWVAFCLYIVLFTILWAIIKKTPSMFFLLPLFAVISAINSVAFFAAVVLSICSWYCLQFLDEWLYSKKIWFRRMLFAPLSTALLAIVLLLLAGISIFSVILIIVSCISSLYCMAYLRSLLFVKRGHRHFFPLSLRTESAIEKIPANAVYIAVGFSLFICIIGFMPSKPLQDKIGYIPSISEYKEHLTIQTEFLNKRQHPFLDISTVASVLESNQIIRQESMSKNNDIEDLSWGAVGLSSDNQLLQKIRDNLSTTNAMNNPKLGLVIVALFLMLIFYGALLVTDDIISSFHRRMNLHFIRKNSEGRIAA